MVIRLIGWGIQERDVLLDIDGMQHWVPVDWTGDDRDPAYCTVNGVRLLIGAVGLTRVQP